MLTNTTSNGSVANNLSGTISANADAAILAFFEKIADNKEAALSLANAVTYTSIQQQLDPMQVLERFSKMEKKELSSYLCMFLNYNRVPTSLLGVSGQPIKNKYIQRSILL